MSGKSKFPTISSIVGREKKLNMLSSDELEKLEQALSNNGATEAKTPTKEESITSPRSEHPLDKVLVPYQNEFMIPKSEFIKLNDPQKVLRRGSFRTKQTEKDLFYILSAEDVLLLKKQTV